MSEELRLVCVLAHPDDESLGTGGILARYGAEGVRTFLVTATRGEHGRCGDRDESPGPKRVGQIREAELRKAAGVLGIDEVHFLGYTDGKLDRADPREIVGRIVTHLRRIRPQVVVTFGLDGAYGHPDHIAISQFTAAACVSAADPAFECSGEAPHRVSKLYYKAWNKAERDLYESRIRKFVMKVDGGTREAFHWPDWAITTEIDTEKYWPRVWEAIRCHQTQLAGYGGLSGLSQEDHRLLWGVQRFCRVFSQVNGGRHVETDLFEGLRDRPGRGETESRQDLPAPSESGGASRSALLDMPAAQFRKAGHVLVDQIADFLGELPTRPVTSFPSPSDVQALLREAAETFPAPADPGSLLSWTAEQLFEHSLHNGHPRFWGYITSSAAPIGMLGDLLAASVNPNVGGWKLSPLATEMEIESVRLIAEMLAYPSECGGLFVSGGNVANLIGLLVARFVKLGPEVRQRGVGVPRASVYASRETHTWLQKATDLSGLGTDSVRWIGTDESQRMDTGELRREIERDLERGFLPLLVVASAGTVSTGAIDPLEELGRICKEYGIWFHVDGAYGAMAALLGDDYPDLQALGTADSIAMDPHKWMYVPLEAGCVLVRDCDLLHQTFSYSPSYYHLDEGTRNFFDFGIQNSRGFRALKVWLALRVAGREGYARMVREDIALARQLFETVLHEECLEAGTNSLSITTFRYVPPDLSSQEGAETEHYLNRLNQEILSLLEKSGEAFLSNAVVDGRFLLRACIVNFRTGTKDIEALPGIVLRYGREADKRLRGERGLTVG